VTIGGIGTYVRRYTCEDIVSGIQSNRVSQRMRSELLAELLRKNSRFHAENNSVELTSQMNTDIWQIANTFTYEVSSAFRGAAFFTGGLGFLLWNCPSLVVVSLLPMVAMAGISLHYSTILRARRKEQAEELRKISQFFQERLAQIKSVKLNSAEDTELSTFSSQLTRYYDLSSIVNHYGAKNLAVVETLGQVAILGCLGFGCHLIGSGTGLTVGSLTSFALYSAYAGLGFRLLSSGYAEMKKAAGVYDKYLSVVTDKGDVEVRALPNQVLPAVSRSRKRYTASISFQDVHFSYPARNIEILKGITLDIQPGEILGIVGKSGDGKSTLFHLLSRLYPVNKGKIVVNGVDIAEYPAEWVRSQLATVSQEALLFSSSIAHNIRYSKASATPEEVIQAAERAHAHQFISALPDGYNTLVGESGLMLSGGQRQRICLARAFLKQPSILLLDEATSGLDMQSETVIQEVLEAELKKQKATVLVITHRLRSLENLVNRVAVVRQGRLEAVGSFEELARVNTYFQELQ